MEEFTSDLLDVVDEAILPEADGGDDGAQQEHGTNPARKARSIRNGIFRAANLQDKLLERYESRLLV
jgi:Zn/Cd-binding protein ZinT